MPVHINLEPGRTPWDLRWSMFGVAIRVHPLYWLTSIMFAFQKELPFSFVLITVACVFVSILVHEFGHIFSGRYYGERGNHVVLWAMGGLAISSGRNPGYWPRVFCLLWGPGAGFILGAIAYIIGGIMYGWTFPIDGFIPFEANRYVFWMLDTLVFVNVAWGVMNLIPVYPLDGGQIMQATAERNRKPEAWAYRVSGFVGVTVVLLAIAVLLVYPKNPVINTPWVPIMFAFLAANSFYLAYQIKKFGDMGGEAGGGVPERREAWEQDPDWWKGR